MPFSVSLFCLHSWNWWDLSNLVKSKNAKSSFLLGCDFASKIGHSNFHPGPWVLHKDIFADYLLYGRAKTEERISPANENANCVQKNAVQMEKRPCGSVSPPVSLSQLGLFVFLFVVRLPLKVSPLLRNARVVAKVFLHHAHAHVDFSTLTHFLPNQTNEGKGIIVFTHTLARPNFTLTYSKLRCLVLFGNAISFMSLETI